MKDEIFGKILRGAREAVQIARGALPPARVTINFGPEEMKKIRRGLGMSQRDFSDRFGIPVETIRHWEQGQRQPDRAAMAFYQVLSKQPDAVMAAFAQPDVPPAVVDRVDLQSKLTQRAYQSTKAHEYFIAILDAGPIRSSLKVAALKSAFQYARTEAGSSPSVSLTGIGPFTLESTEHVCEANTVW